MKLIRFPIDDLKKPESTDSAELSVWVLNKYGKSADAFLALEDSSMAPSPSYLKFEDTDKAVGKVGGVLKIGGAKSGKKAVQSGMTYEVGMTYEGGMTYAVRRKID